MLKSYQQSHMTLFIVPTIHIGVIWLATESILLKSIAGQKTVPMSDYLFDLLCHLGLFKFNKEGVILKPTCYTIIYIFLEVISLLSIVL